jgi:hypothetical protein
MMTQESDETMGFFYRRKDPLINKFGNCDSKNGKLAKPVYLLTFSCFEEH